MATTIDQVEQLEASATEDFARLVRDPGSISAREADAILQRCGKTAEHLRAAVELRRSRKKWAAEADGKLTTEDRFQLSDIQKEVESLSERCDELAAEMNEIKREAAVLETRRLTP